MKIIGFYCDYRPRKERIKSYSKIVLKLSVLTLLVLHNPSTAAFKANAVYELINALPMPLVP